MQEILYMMDKHEAPAFAKATAGKLHPKHETMLKFKIPNSSFKI